MIRVLHGFTMVDNDHYRHINSSLVTKSRDMLMEVADRQSPYPMDKLAAGE